MPFRLIYFHPPDTFKVKVKVTETSIFWSKIGNFENFCYVIYLFRLLLAFSFRNMLQSASLLNIYDNMS